MCTVDVVCNYGDIQHTLSLRAARSRLTDKISSPIELQELEQVLAWDMAAMSDLTDIISSFNLFKSLVIKCLETSSPDGGGAEAT